MCQANAEVDALPIALIGFYICSKKDIHASCAELLYEKNSGEFFDYEDMPNDP